MPVRLPHASPAADVLAAFGSSPDGLSEGEAAARLDRGASAFLVYSKTQNAGATAVPNPVPNKQPGTRVILLQHGRVVGDFRAP